MGDMEYHFTVLPHEVLKNFYLRIIWRRLAAGGYLNNSEPFHINPRLHHTVNDAVDIVIRLNQCPKLKVTGFSVCPLLQAIVSSYVNSNPKAERRKPKFRFRLESFRLQIISSHSVVCCQNHSR
ncbi:hypothetical protein GHT06_014028 [Daphnia sinensis]|uniref:Uncharacterized protein n=1 Tax=Daphnia sinensis TaxID=1820382 RepID=A0AAD5LD34_9CRUS|nr:hypothetical protein GHT06_014028 [Daphnia sinensis]